MDRNQIKNIKQSANEFFQAAQKYVQDQEGALIRILIMTTKGPPLDMDSNVQEKQEKLVKQCIDSLGVELGSDEEIEELIWDHFWRSFSDTRTEITEQLLGAELGSDEEREKLWDHFGRSFLDTNRILNISEITERFLDDISRYEQRSYGYLAPNFVIEFSADPLERADFASQLRSLYVVRSALVHAGKRDVSQKQTMEAQRIAEELYKTVMENYPLDSMVNKFQESLSKASYGSPWPLSNSNRSL